MKIGIDARFVGPGGTGLGKYTEKLIINLAKIDSKNQYRIFLRKNNWDYLKLENNFKKVLADVPWYSVSEQFKLPSIFKKQDLDLLHIPHFNVPIFYHEKFIVTIHDLIHHHFSEYAATTKNPIIFKIKRFAYRRVINHAIYQSAKILTPSNFVKNQILDKFNVKPDKVVVTYEAAEEEYFSRTKNSELRTQNYLIYVGNAYPHKNLEKLLDALKILTINYELRTMNLILVCPRDIFSERLKSEIAKRDLQSVVELKGYMEPNQLSQLFHKSKAYIFPSLSEGFGIPGLNAMASEIPVLASDIPVLKEIYQNAAIYFDPNDPNDVSEKIKEVVLSPKTTSDLVSIGKVQVKKYSWQKMARETLEVYSQFSKK